jgi:hypothetical protein
MRCSIAIVADARFCCVSDDLTMCFGVVEDKEQKPLTCVAWKSSSVKTVMQLPLSLTSTRAK